MNRRELFKGIAAIPIVTVIPDWVTSGKAFIDVDINDGEWHYIACSRNYGVVTYYVDGFEVADKGQFSCILSPSHHDQSTISLHYKKDAHKTMPEEAVLRGMS